MFCHWSVLLCCIAISCGCGDHQCCCWWHAGAQVGLETTCVIICSLMLVSIFKTGQNYMSEEEECEFMERCKAFVTYYRSVTASISFVLKASCFSARNAILPKGGLTASRRPVSCPANQGLAVSASISRPAVEFGAPTLWVPAIWQSWHLKCCIFVVDALFVVEMQYNIHLDSGSASLLRPLLPPCSGCLTICAAQVTALLPLPAHLPCTGLSAVSRAGGGKCLLLSS